MGSILGGQRGPGQLSLLAVGVAEGASGTPLSGSAPQDAEAGVLLRWGGGPRLVWPDSSESDYHDLRGRESQPIPPQVHAHTVDMGTSGF